MALINKVTTPNYFVLKLRHLNLRTSLFILFVYETDVRNETVMLAKKKYPWINVLYSAAIHCSTAQHPAKDASYVNTPQSLPLSLCNAAYAERKKSDVMPACPRLSSPLTHTSTHTHTHMQTNVIYSIITSMTVQIQAHHSVLSNYWGV